MNIKMAIHSQLLTIESKKQTKQTSRTKTESRIWRSHGEMSAGRGWGRREEKGQGIRRRNGRCKIDRGKLRLVWKMEKPKNLYIWLMDMN